MLTLQLWFFCLTLGREIFRQNMCVGIIFLRICTFQFSSHCSQIYQKCSRYRKFEEKKVKHTFHINLPSHILLFHSTAFNFSKCLGTKYELPKNRLVYISRDCQIKQLIGGNGLCYKNRFKKRRQNKRIKLPNECTWGTLSSSHRLKYSA